MPTYAFILGCEGAPPPNYPDDVKRCWRCVEGTCGLLEITTPYLPDVLECLTKGDWAERSIVDIANEINSSGQVLPVSTLEQPDFALVHS